MKLYRREVKCDVGLLKFMFPTYEIIDDNNIPTFPDRPAIFVGTVKGKEELVKVYNQTDLDYIVVSPFATIDLTDRRQLVQVGFEKWNSFVPKYLTGSGEEKKRGKGVDMGFIDQMEYDDFIWAFKHHWVTGKWEIKKLADENTFLELITEVNQPKLDVIKRFFEVVNDTRPYRIESSLMTFLLRVKYGNCRGITSKSYKAAIRAYSVSNFKKSLDALYEALDSNIDNYTLRLLYLLMLIVDHNRA
jgi:hypothetical protein